TGARAGARSRLPGLRPVRVRGGGSEAGGRAAPRARGVGLHRRDRAPPRRRAGRRAGLARAARRRAGRDTRRMIAAFSVTPLGLTDSVGDLVADAVRVVRDGGLPAETNAMFTNAEGEWDP